MKPPHFLKHLITLQSSDPEGFRFCLLVLLLSFILPLSCKNLWGSCHSPILFSTTFMWQLSIYCVPIPNLPFALLCNSRTRPYKQSSLPASTMLGVVTREQWKDTQRQEQQENIFIRVPVLRFKIQCGSPVSSKISSSCTLRPRSSHLRALTSFFAIGNTAIPISKRLNFSLGLGKRLCHKSSKFLHFPLFLNLYLMTASLHLAPVTSGPLRARLALF